MNVTCRGLNSFLGPVKRPGPWGKRWGRGRGSHALGKVSERSSSAPGPYLSLCS